MTAGIRHDDLRRRNRAMVIAAARRGGQASRTGIAAATKLSHSTISAISADLISEGILVEIKAGEQTIVRRGRPQVALSLDPAAASVIVAVLSLNDLSAAVIDYSGRTVLEDNRKLSTAAITREDLVAELVAMLRRLMARDAGLRTRPMRIVLAIQGITDASARMLLWSPITPHRDIAFADIIEREFNVSTTVENDCNMMAVALRQRNPARYRDDFVTILLSHGIGMGLIRNGELFTGTRSSGGELGHITYQPGGARCRCGRRGCLEAYAGDYAILRNAKGRNEASEPQDGVSNADMQAIAALARAADGREREAYRKAGTAMGYAIGSLFALIDPTPVAFVGAGVNAFDLLEPHIRAALAETAGGHRIDDISFDTVADELPLILQGCALRALTFVDDEVFAAGLDTFDVKGKQVA